MDVAAVGGHAALLERVMREARAVFAVAALVSGGALLAAPPPVAIRSIELPSHAGAPPPSRYPPLLSPAEVVTVAIPARPAAGLVGSHPVAEQPDAQHIGRGHALPARVFTPGDWWPSADGGAVLGVRIDAPGAVGLRVSLARSQLPASASLRLFGRADTQAEAISGAEIAGATAAGVYWSPPVAGDSITLEILLPPGVSAPAKLRLPRLSHLARWPWATDDPDLDRPARCAKPLPASQDLTVLARATVRLLVTDPDGASRVCTGVLLNSTPPTFTPYLLTAAHCVSTPAQAASLAIGWLTASGVVSAPGAAALRYTLPHTDTSLLRLRQPPPTGVVLAGWSTLPVSGDTPLITLHRPRGQPNRYARGALIESIHCAEVDLCEADAEPRSTHLLRIDWATGCTAAGSSGAGLYDASGRLVGVLSGGYRPFGPADFGEFATTYRRGRLWRWLGPPPP